MPDMDPDDTIYYSRYRNSNGNVIHVTRDCDRLSPAYNVVERDLSWLLTNEGEIPDGWDLCQWCGSDDGRPLSGYTPPTAHDALDEMDPEDLEI